MRDHSRRKPCHRENASAREQVLRVRDRRARRVACDGDETDTNECVSRVARYDRWHIPSQGDLPGVRVRRLIVTTQHSRR